MTTVGVVIIGRNEGQRLATCLESVTKAAAGEGAAAFTVVQIVYVDSNSTDNSVQIAREHGAQIIQLDPEVRFTAARARNAGAEALLRRHPQVDLLQFLDGDTELNPRWLSHAVDYLHHHPAVAVACGRRERHPDASVFNLLTDMEWDTPVGECGEFGGDSLIRATVFVHLGGYNAGFIAGEEPELAARMRLDGHKLVRLNHEMTLHDVAMTRFGQWWKRAKRSGHALAQLAHTHGKAPLYFYRHAWKSTLLWGMCVPLFILTVAIVVSPWLLGLFPVAYTYLLRRVTRYRMGRGDDRGSALLYAMFIVLGKFPEMVGLLTFYVNLWMRRQSRLIEYKSAPPVGVGNPGATVVGNT